MNIVWYQLNRIVGLNFNIEVYNSDCCDTESFIRWTFLKRTDIIFCKIERIVLQYNATVELYSYLNEQDRMSKFSVVFIVLIQLAMNIFPALVYAPKCVLITPCSL